MDTSLLLQQLKNFSSADLPPDSRLAAAVMSAKYGLRNLEIFKDVHRSIPATLPEQNQLKLFSKLIGVSIESTTEMVADIRRLLPTFLNATVTNNREVIAPPVQFCLNECVWKIGANKGAKRPLNWHRDPTKAKLYCLGGEVKDLDVVTLRCLGCESRYQYSKWTDHGSQHYSFYAEPRQYLQVTQGVFFSNELSTFLISSIMHCQSTFEGFAEAMKRTHSWDNQFSRKIVSRAFFVGQIERELRERGQIEHKFSEGKDILQCLPELEKAIFSSTYEHSCTDVCRELNCDKLAVGDGFWKIGYRHCAAKVTNTLKEFPLVNYPNVCTNGCKGNSAFCEQHQPSNEGPSSSTMSNKKPRMDILNDIMIAGIETLPESDRQGKQIAEKLNDLLSPDVDVTIQSQLENSCPEFDPTKMCQKNKGDGERGYTYSRGYFVIVRSTGIIDMFAPLFRAESLGQVFLIVVVWLYQRLLHMPVEEWGQLHLAYDNMCQLNRLKATKSPLPLPAPYDTMWNKISKMIDGLHLANHKNPECKELYNPDKFVKMFGEKSGRNTMAAEQTNSWLVKYKKQLNSMPRGHQIFFFNRLVVNRNRYIENCLANRRKVVGPGRRTFAERSD